MTRAASVLLVFAIFGCKTHQDPPSPSPPSPSPPPLQLAAEGETCALGNRATHLCPTNLRCVPRPPAPAPAPPPSVAPGTRTPNVEGQPCGGIAGFMCAPGLGCDMGDQPPVPDGMGVCARVSVCSR